MTGGDKVHRFLRSGNKFRWDHRTSGMREPESDQLLTSIYSMGPLYYHFHVSIFSRDLKRQLRQRGGGLTNQILHVVVFSSDVWSKPLAARNHRPEVLEWSDMGADRERRHQCTHQNQYADIKRPSVPLMYSIAPFPCFPFCEVLHPECEEGSNVADTELGGFLHRYFVCLGRRV